MADINSELDLLIAEREHVETVARLKAACDGLPGNDPLHKEYRAAKLAHREFRKTWRTIRHFQQVAALTNGDAAAILAMVGAGGAIAAPATVAVTAEAHHTTQEA